MEFRYLGEAACWSARSRTATGSPTARRSRRTRRRRACDAALDAGITTFDTADVYADRRAEAVLGRALAGERREGLEIFTKVYWPTGPGPERPRAVAQAHPRVIDASLRRLGTDYVDLYQAHRYDYETPLEETMTAFADLVRPGKVLYIGVSEWRAEEIAAAAALARELRIPFVSNQPQYSMLWRVIEAEVVPACRELGIGADRVVADRAGRADREVPAGPGATRRLAGHRPKGGADVIGGWLDDEVLNRVQRLQPIAEEAGLTMAQLAVAWVLQNDNVAAAIIGAVPSRAGPRERRGRRRTARRGDHAAIDKALDGVVDGRPGRDRQPGRATGGLSQHELGRVLGPGPRRRPVRLGRATLPSA